MSTCRASCGDRSGRNPTLTGAKSASKTGSSTIFNVACTIRSRTAGTNSGLCSPAGAPGLGANTRRAGSGRYVLSRSSPASSPSSRATPYCSTWAKVVLSTPGASLLRRTTARSPSRLRFQAPRRFHGLLSEGSALPLPALAGGTSNDAAGFASCYGLHRRSPLQDFGAGLRPGPFPNRGASLLPGLLAATRTGLPPAGDDELTNTKTHHGLTSRRHLRFCWAHETSRLRCRCSRRTGPPPAGTGADLAVPHCGTRKNALFGLN
jgi:hypothetical protein